MATIATTAMRERLDCLLAGADLRPGFGRGSPDPSRADRGGRGGRGDGTAVRTVPVPAAPFAAGRLAAGPSEVNPSEVSPSGMGPFGMGPFEVSPFGMGPFTPGPLAMGPLAAGPFAAGPFTVGSFAMGPFGVGPFTAGTVGAARSRGLAWPPRSLPAEDTIACPLPSPFQRTIYFPGCVTPRKVLAFIVGPLAAGESQLHLDVPILEVQR